MAPNVVVPIGTLLLSGFALGLRPPLPRRRAPTRLFVDLGEGGRGHEHLSARLDDGDVVLYRTGNWEVDGVPVGQGPSELRLARITLTQLVFTHNCEHGWIYGEPLRACAEADSPSLKLEDDDQLGADVQFGPEQLVAILDDIIRDDDDDSSRFMRSSLPPELADALVVT